MKSRDCVASDIRPDSVLNFKVNIHPHIFYDHLSYGFRNSMLYVELLCGWCALKRNVLGLINSRFFVIIFCRIDCVYNTFIKIKFAFTPPHLQTDSHTTIPRTIKYPFHSEYLKYPNWSTYKFLPVHFVLIFWQLITARILISVYRSKMRRFSFPAYPLVLSFTNTIEHERCCRGDRLADMWLERVWWINSQTILILLVSDCEKLSVEENFGS